MWYVHVKPRHEMLIAVDAPRSVPDHTKENYARRSCETALQKHSCEHVGSFAGVAALFIRWYEIETQHFVDVKVKPSGLCTNPPPASTACGTSPCAGTRT